MGEPNTFESSMNCRDYKRCLFPFTALLISLMSASSAAAPRYEVINLGSLGGPRYRDTFAGIIGKLLNNYGLASAGMETAQKDPLCLNDGCLASHAFLWNNGALSDLGLLASGDNANFSQAFSMNEQNNCAGISTFDANDGLGGPLFRAVLWKFRQGAAPQTIDLGTLGGKQSLAHAINNHDQVVGWALNQTAASTNIWEPYPWPLVTQQRAVLWENGTIQDLGTLGGQSAWASHINDRGQIIGQSFTAATGSRSRTIEEVTWTRPVAGFLWENGKMIDLGNLGGTYMLPIYISNQGQIMGMMSTRNDSNFHPFLWTNGVLKDLGTLGGASGHPSTMNESGEVVGYAATSSGANNAFLWRDGRMQNLGTLGANSAAWAINAKTQIVGTSGHTLSENRAFFWEDKGEPMRDLNDLVPPGSPHLAHAFGINDRGEILVGGLNEKGLYLLVPLPKLAIRMAEGAGERRLVVEAQTIPGRSYRLENSSDLKTWTTIGTTLIATQEKTTWESQAGDLPLFYRLAGQ